MMVPIGFMLLRPEVLVRATAIDAIVEEKQVEAIAKPGSVTLTYGVPRFSWIEGIDFRNLPGRNVRIRYGEKEVVLPDTTLAQFIIRMTNVMNGHIDYLGIERAAAEETKCAS